METPERCETCPERMGSPFLCRAMVLEGLCDMYPLSASLVEIDISKPAYEDIETEIKLQFWQKPNYNGNLLHPKEEYL